MGKSTVPHPESLFGRGIASRVVATLAALKAQTGMKDGQPFIVRAGVGQGSAVFRSGDYSEQVAAWPERFVAPDSDPSGASGVFEFDATTRGANPENKSPKAFKNFYSPPLIDQYQRARDLCPGNVPYIWKAPFWATTNSDYRFSLGVNFGRRTAEWGFGLDVDGFMRILNGYAGSTRDPNLGIDAGTFSGSPVVAGFNGYYLAPGQVGETFEVEFTGGGLLFGHYLDDRGGMWSISVDGGDPILVSTHVDNVQNAQASGSLIYKKIIDGLDAAVTHTAVFTFTGDDPDHVPSGGAGTSRGWFRTSDGTDSDFTTYVFRGNEWGLASFGPLVSPGILEFAIRAKEAGAGYGDDWVPSHSNVPDAMTLVSRSIYINGDLVLDESAITGNEVEVKEFTMRQRYKAHCTNDGSKTELWDGEIIHKFDRDGLHISHEFLFLEDTEISTGYTCMANGRRTVTNQVLRLDNGYEIDLSAAAPGSPVVHTPGPARSAAWFGESEVLALRVENGEASAGYFAGHDGTTLPNEPIYITERTDGFVKLYFWPFHGGVVPAGHRATARHSLFLGAR